MPKNFKILPLTSFDGKSDPQEHIIFVNNQMAIIGASGSLKYKLMAETFNDVALRWYTSIPRDPILGYLDLACKWFNTLRLANTERYQPLVSSMYVEDRVNLSGSIWHDLMRRPSRCLTKSRNVRWGFPK